MPTPMIANDTVCLFSFVAGYVVWSGVEIGEDEVSGADVELFVLGDVGLLESGDMVEESAPIVNVLILLQSPVSPWNSNDKL